MAHPAIWGLALAAGETTIGLFLLTGGKCALFVGEQSSRSTLP